MVPNHKMRDMKKEAKVEFGITITKPWSSEMYDHNELVADQVKDIVLQMWTDALNEAKALFVDEDDLGNEFEDLQWEYEASKAMLDIQRAITCYGFGSGYDIVEVAERVEQELEDAPLYHLKEIAEELEIKLEKGFVGFS
jgi:hypothetical protein